MNDQPSAPNWDELYNDRDQYRERIFRGVRGWLRKKSRPRAAVLFLFLISVVPCIAAACQAAAAHGSNRFGLPQITGLLLALPLFMLLLRWLAAFEARRMDLSDDWSDFLAHDKSVVAKELDGLLAEPVDPNTTRQALRGVRHTGAGGVILIFFLAVCTLGIWLVWSLVNNSATLLAGIILDGELAPRHPELADRIGAEPWYKEALSIVGFHFFGFVAVVLIIGFFARTFA